MGTEASNFNNAAAKQNHQLGEEETKPNTKLGTKPSSLKFGK